MAGSATVSNVGGGQHQHSGSEIVYEVESSLDPAVVADYDAWLPGHVAQVLESPGFVEAEVLRPTEPAPDGRFRRISRYRVRDRAALEAYFETRAPALRADGLARFGEHARFDRRVLEPGVRAIATAVPRCANCAAPLAGEYCAACGQHAHGSARSMGTLLHDAWHVLTHVDGRFWQTLRLLLLHPGALTREYFADRRARYLPPFRLYLIVSLVFFGVAAVLPDEGATALSVDAPARAGPERSREEALRAAAAELRAAAASGERLPVGAEFLAGQLERQADAARAEAGGSAGPTVAASRAPDAAATREGAGEAVPGTAPTGGTGGVPVAAPQSPVDLGVATARPRVRVETPEDCDELSIAASPRLEATLREGCRRVARDGGTALSRTFAANVPKMMFVFLPLMAAVMLLLYWRPRRWYVEHLVFYLHVHAALFLALLVLLPASRFADAAGLGLLSSLAWLVGFGYAGWYVWRAMRTFYANGRALTLTKYATIGVAYVAFLALTLAGTALVSIVTA